MTFLGHAGMYVETEGGSVLCDPWFNPAFFGSWFPFPRNDWLDPADFGAPDYLYISHLHHDHFDPAWLADHVDQSARVLLPAFELDHLERSLARSRVQPSSSGPSTRSRSSSTGSRSRSSR